MKIDLLPSGKVVFSINRGEDLRYSLTDCRDTNGDLVDFTGATFLTEVRTKAGVLIGTGTVSILGVGELGVVFEDTYSWLPQDAETDMHAVLSSGFQLWLLPLSVIRIEKSASVIP